MRSRPFLLASLPLVAPIAAAQTPAAYTAIDLGTLPGRVGAAAYDINEAGWVTGNSHQAFRWRPGSGMEALLPLPGGAVASGNALNLAGVVVGESDDPARTGPAVRWVASAPQSLPGQAPGTWYAEAHGINDAGDTVGHVGYRARLWRADGSSLDLGVLPGDVMSIAYDISNSGVIVGQSGNSQNSRAFRWTAATGMVPLPKPFPDLGAAAKAVNESGEAAGWAYQRVSYAGGNPIIVYRAALWTASGQFIDLGEPLFPAISSIAEDINDHGHIVGSNMDQIAETPWIWTAAEGFINLRTRIQPNSGIRVRKPMAINNAGQIAGEGVFGETRINAFLLNPVGGAPCYPNCDASTAAPVLNVLDFNCFLNRFSAGDSHANCDHSTAPPTLNVLDFNCFLNRFSQGCP